MSIPFKKNIAQRIGVEFVQFAIHILFTNIPRYNGNKLLQNYDERTDDFRRPPERNYIRRCQFVSVLTRVAIFSVRKIALMIEPVRTLCFTLSTSPIELDAMKNTGAILLPT